MEDVLAVNSLGTIPQPVSSTDRTKLVPILNSHQIIMGSLLSHSAKLILIGLDNSGKTAILNRLK